MNTYSPRKFMARGAFFALLIPLFILGFGLATMFLWNALIPALFAGPVVSFWQAIGLIVLARMLVGFGRGGGRWGGRGKHAGWSKRKEYWNRMQSMSPEEREAYKTSRKGRWAEACRPAKKGGDTDAGETVVLPSDPA